MTILAAGTKAPDFTLNATPDQQVSLQDFRGHPLIIAFYPADWSPVCGDQMAAPGHLAEVSWGSALEAARLAVAAAVARGGPGPVSTAGGHSGRG